MDNDVMIVAAILSSEGPKMIHMNCFPVNSTDTKYKVTGEAYRINPILRRGQIISDINNRKFVIIGKNEGRINQYIVAEIG